MVFNLVSYYDHSSSSNLFDVHVTYLISHLSSTFPSIPGTAENGKERDQVPAILIYKLPARQLASELANHINHRFGTPWKPVDAAVITWCPKDEDEPERFMRSPRRVLLFHLASILDINECKLEFIQLSEENNEWYYKSLCSTVAREALELGDTAKVSMEQLKTICFIFHSNMRKDLQKIRQREPQHE